VRTISILAAASYGDRDVRVQRVARDGVTRSRSPVDMVFGAVVPRAIDAVDLDEVLEQVDLDALLARIDVDALIARIDVDGLIGRIDLDALLARIDMPALVARAGIDQVVADATTGIATRTLDLVRRQLFGLDVVVLRAVDRLLRREPQPAPDLVAGPPPAGPLSRLSGFLVDSAVVSTAFSLVVLLGNTLADLFTNRSIDVQDQGGPLWAVLFFGWWFVYLWAGVAISGRTVGKILVGLKVVSLPGGAVGPARSAIRAVVFPFSFILGLGFIPAIVGRQRRALHDHAAGTREVVDWGRRQAKLPNALETWFEDRAA
jgi:uncharacterized RDD family membrane protein YckC